MDQAAIEESVRSFLISEVFYDKPLDAMALGPTDSLIGLLESVDIMRLVTFCEESFGIEVPDAEIVPEHFDDIRSISALIASQLKS